jgi:2-polyprenyl-3-methyl-5-hydroxy-6-metoxy-1,4-benzoquinol methylase
MIELKKNKSHVPLPRRFLQTIKRFLKLLGKVFFSTNNKTFMLVHINVFFQLSI